MKLQIKKKISSLSSSSSWTKPRRSRWRRSGSATIFGATSIPTRRFSSSVSISTRKPDRSPRGVTKRSDSSAVARRKNIDASDAFRMNDLQINFHSTGCATGVRKIIGKLSVCGIPDNWEAQRTLFLSESWYQRSPYRSITADAEGFFHSLPTANLC